MNKVKIVAVLIIVLVSFAAGRYTVSRSVEKVEEKIVDKKIDIKEDTKSNLKTTTVTVKLPTGEERTTTVTEVNTEEHKEVAKTETDKTVTKTVEVTGGKTPLTLSGMASIAPFKGDFLPVYGLLVQKQVMGPVSVGLWGSTNGVVGITVGVSF